MTDPEDPIAYGLPHREPFIFIDKVISVVPGTAATCSKVFRGGEPFFQGHFPGDPLVPGVLLTEALAQTAGIAAGSSGEGLTFRLSAIRQMKFLKAVRPDEEVILKAEKTADAGGLFQLTVSAAVNSVIVAEGSIVLNSR